MNSKYLDFAQIAIAKGAVEGIGQGRYIPQPLAVNCFHTDTKFFSYLSHLQLIWQKLLAKVQKDSSTIEHIFKLADKDPYVNFIREIYERTKSKQKRDFLTFFRCDYLMDGESQPKLIEYNVMQMGLFNISEIISSSYILWSGEREEDYFENKTTEFFAAVVAEHYKLRDLKGLFVILVSSCEIQTIVEQKNLEFLLRKAGVRVKRIKYRDLLDSGEMNEDGDLLLDGELVSFAYFRSGFLMKEYKEVGSMEDAIRARVMLAGSNITCIPSIRMEVLNTKIAQSYLTKPEILSKFLSESEVQQLSKSIIEDHNICKMSNEELEALIQKAKQDPTGWVLKPNMDGGKNNIFGEAVIETLENLKNLEYRDFVLMKLIKDCPIYDNGSIIRGYRYFPIRCTYEFSRFGAFSEINGSLVRNSASGYAIKTREEGKNESDYYWGCDAYATWKKSDSKSKEALMSQAVSQSKTIPDHQPIQDPVSLQPQQNISKQQTQQCQKFLPSKISKTKSQITFIQQSLKKAKRLQLLYRASQHEFSAQKFHQTCDNVPDTFVLVLTQFGKKVGGFTHYMWNDPKKDAYGWVNDEEMDAFLVSVSLKQKMVPNDTSYLIQCNPSFGPCFGSGCSDLYISNQCDKNSGSYSYFPHSYNLESGDRYLNNQHSWNSFVGATKGYHFRVLEYEVFKVIH